MTRKMTSRKALKKLSYVPIFEDDERNIITDIDCCCVYKGDLCEVYEREVNIIKRDLYLLKKLKKENQELKEKINHFEKIIEEIKNLPDCDFKNNLLNNIGFKHMFDNCKLTPLPESPELENELEKLKK